MRNILKPAARTASSRARRSVRGVAAVVASVALAAGLGSYPVDAQETSAETTTSATAETAASTTTAAETPTSSQTFSAAPKPVVVEPNSVTVEREDDVDHITIRDTDDNPWDSGRKASDEYIWGVKRTGDGDITRIVKVVADGEELDPQYFGYVNGEDFDVIGIDEDAFWTIPPMELEIEVETTEAGEYAIAEPDEVPTARELSETGYGCTDQAAATVNPEGVGMARAAAPGNIPGVPGEQDQELNLSSPKAEWVNSNPQLQFKVNESGSWRMTRFAIKKDKNDSNSKDITGPVRIQVIRDGAVVSDRTIDPEKIFWGTNAKGKSYDTEFQLIPDTMDLFVQGGDTVILNPVGPPNGTYQVQMWGQDLDNEPQDHDVTVIGEGIPVSDPKTVGSNPYETTFIIGSRSNFSSAKVTLSPSVRLEDVFLSVPIEAAEGVRLEHEVKTFSDRVEITWYPTKNGARVGSVVVPAGSTATLRTSYRSNPTREERLVLKGTAADPAEAGSRLPIAPIEENDVPPTTSPGDRCVHRDTSPVQRKRRRELTQAEEDYGFRRYIVASPVSTESRISSQLYLLVDGENGRMETHEVGPKSGWVYNALAFNKNDNYLYAISEPRYHLNGGYVDDPCFQAGHLLQIDPYTGEVYDLGKVTGFQGQLPENKRVTTANDLGSGVNSGSFDEDGNYWVSASSNWGTGMLYRVDLDRKTAFTNAKLQNAVSSQPFAEKTPYRTVSEDLVSLPGAPGYLWGLQSSWANPNDPGRVFLERVSTNGESAVRTEITNMLVPGTQQTVGQFVRAAPDRFHVFGQAWLEKDGSMAFGLGGGAVGADQHEAQVVKLKVENPSASYSDRRKIAVKISGSSWGPVSYNTDGTSAPAIDNPRPPVEPDIVKQAIGAAEKLDEGTYRIKYLVEVQNPDTSRDATYRRVTDTPAVPSGVSVLKASWVKTDEFGSKSRRTHQSGSGPFVLSEQDTIRPRGATEAGRSSSGVHSFELEMIIAIEDPAPVPEGEECSANSGFIFNAATVGSKTATACVPPPENTSETVKLHLVKVSKDTFDHGDIAGALIEGAEFELQEVSDVSEQTGESTVLQFDPELNKFSTEELTPGRYRLVETKAPKDVDGRSYSLLVAPIEFEIRIVKENGQSKVQVDFDSGEIMARQIPTEDSPGQWNLSSSDAVIAVANVRQGNLPKTGGVGVQLPILLGGALIAAGALMGRRKVAA